MTWTISHGRSRPGHVLDGVECFGYGTVGEWRDALNARKLGSRERGILEPLLRRRSGDPFTISDRQAGAIARILRDVQGQLPRNLRTVNASIAYAADRAFALGQPWRWS